MPEVVIVFHSGYGHTRKVAEQVAEGAAINCTSTLMPIEDLEGSCAEGWSKLDRADAIIFGAPTYMGDCSSRMRAFLESTSQRWMTMAWKDKLAAGFTNSGSRHGDKHNTLVSLATFAAQHGMIWVSLGIPPGNNSSTGSARDINRLGASLGMMAQSNVDEPPDVAPPLADLETACLFGARFAQCATRWARTQETYYA